MHQLSSSLISLPISHSPCLAFNYWTAPAIHSFHSSTAFAFASQQLGPPLRVLPAVGSGSCAWANGCSGIGGRSRRLLCSARMCASPQSGRNKHTLLPSSTKTPIAAALPASKTNHEVRWSVIVEYDIWRHAMLSLDLSNLSSRASIASWIP